MAALTLDAVRRVVRPVVAFGLLSVALAGAELGRADEPVSPLPQLSQPQPAPQLVEGRELTTLRSKTSRTYMDTDGVYRTVVSTRPLHHLDKDGWWQPIDTSLVPADAGGYRHSASSFDTWLPPSLTQPVRLEQNGHSVSLTLEGAGGILTVSGDAATYMNALPGIDVVYTAQSDGVKEELILTSASVPTEFRFRVYLSPGLTVRMVPPGIARIVDSKGTVVFSLEAPHLVDASGKLGTFARAKVLATKDATGFVLDVEIDPKWLNSPDRVYPVTIDPTLVVGGTDQWGQPVYLDCLITSSSLANSTECDRDSFGAGKDGGLIYRTLMRWDVSDIPSTATVETAELRLNAPTVWPPGQPQTINVHRLTRTHAVGATWNTYNGANAWTSAGGDYAAPIEASATLTNFGEWYGWYPTALVRGWVNGSIANQGLLLKGSNEALANVYSAFWSAERTPEGFGPLLIVAWADAEPPQQDSSEAPVFSNQAPVEAPTPAATDCDNPDALDNGPPDPVLCGGGSSPAGAVGDAAVASTAQAVTLTSNTDMFKFRNADGEWTIYKKCIDRNNVAGLDLTVGPGYIARFKRGSTTYVEDYRGRSADDNDPGFLNAVNGGLGTFGWHHARGPAGIVHAGNDPTTPTVTELATGRFPYGVIEGRMCAQANSSYGVCARSWTPPSPPTNGRVDFNMDVWLREGTAPAGCPANAIARIRYRYSFYRSSVRAWMSVTTYPTTGSGTPYVKEPKFTAILRGGGYTRMSTIHENGNFLAGVMEGHPEGTTGAALGTGHSGFDMRARVRWDKGTTTTGQQTDAQACPNSLCFSVVMRAYPGGTNGNITRFGSTQRWEVNAGNLGLDRWAELSDGRGKAYPRDTFGDLQVNSCRIIPVPDADGDGDITDDDYDESKASEAASPIQDIRRKWEHGGFKSGATTTAYQVAFTFFTGWEDDRGPYDCEPVQRRFGVSSESFGTFASYSLGKGWALE